MRQTYGNTPLSADYWRAARSELNNPRMLAFAALMIAACTALTLIPSIPTTDPNVRVTWGFLARAVCGMVCGPVVALVFGAAEDTINFLIAPSGPYFPGYTLTTMIGTFLYAIFLYRMKKPTPPVLLLRVFLAKLSTNILNVVLGSLWSAILYSKGYLYYASTSLVKNAIMLPVQTAMLAVFFAAALPILSRIGFLPSGVGNKLKFK